MSTITYDTKKLLAKALSSLASQTVDLCPSDRNDELSDQQVADILRGQMFEVQDGISEGTFNNDHTAIECELEVCLPDDAERAVFLQSDEFQEFADACHEADTSSPYQNMVDGTGRRMVRFHFPRPDDGYEQYFRDAMADMASESWQWDAARTEAEARRLGTIAGVDWEKNKEHLTDLVENATYGGELCVLAYVEFDALEAACAHVLKEEGNSFAVTFEGDNIPLLVLGLWNGSGHDTEVSGKITLTFNRQDLANGRLAHDAKGVGEGYDWTDSIAGVSKPAYKMDPTFKYLNQASTQE